MCTFSKKKDNHGPWKKYSCNQCEKWLDSKTKYMNTYDETIEGKLFTCNKCEYKH